jgi:hypothetical protein
MPHARAAYLPVVVVIVVSRYQGPLKVVLAPLLAAHDALPHTVDGNVRRWLLAAAWGHLLASLGKAEFGRLIAGGEMGGDVAWLLDGLPKNVVVFTLVWVLCVVFE